jgi:putative transposase
VLPLLYLRGLSTGDFVPALEGFLGTAAGLSSATIVRLTTQWADDYHAFCQRDLSGVDYVYVWVDGIHVRVRLGADKLCLLVIVGVRADGTKELVALADGYRESAGSWADLLRDCARGSRAAGLAMAFKLIESAQQRWRAVNAPHLVALVRAGATFRNRQLVERHDRAAAA